MNYLYCELDKLLALYESLIKMYSNDIETAPKGILHHQISHGYDQFLLVNNIEGKRTRKSITNNELIKQALAKKEFAEKALTILEQNVSALKIALQKQKDFDPDEILRSMTKAYALLPEDYFFDRDMLNIMHGLDGATEAKIRRHEEWGRQPYEEYWGHPEKKTKRSSRGQYVRSKSELLIIESLYKYDIPFHYEEELWFKGVLYAPDFKFLDQHGIPFYWEHLGMMNVRSYAKKNITKLDEYYDIGLIPGDNLILTFDRGNDIDMGLIDAIIQNEVITRL